MSEETNDVLSDHRHYVNPGWADIVDALGLPISGLRGEGSWIVTEDGAGMLDMIACFGAAVLGHNPPVLLAAIHRALDRHSPMTAPLGVIPEAGQLASTLLSLAGHGLTKVHFASSGAEAVDTALKSAAAITGRNRFIAIKGGFHGLSIGATSLAGGGGWRAPFPDLWLPCLHVECGDLSDLEHQLARGDVAAVFLEPVPGSDAGDGWLPEDLSNVGALCRHYGAMLIVDEVQTGLGRTGAWFAFHGAGADFHPDVVLVSKALTGGMLPVSAVLMTEAVFAAVFGSPGCAKIHGSTLAGNRLAMECGLAVLRALDDGRLIARAEAAGQRLRMGLEEKSGSGGEGRVLGRGLLLSFQCGKTVEEANTNWLQMVRHGLLVSRVPHAPTFARLTPAFTISDDDIDLFLDGVIVTG